MQRAAVNNVELEFEARGSGEAVVLIHGGLLADENTPLLGESALTDRFRVINYHRRGFCGSSASQRPAAVADQVADCRALLEYLGVHHAHVVGHSLGGVIALQLALEAPALVQSLALLEPALMSAIARSEGTLRPETLASQHQFRHSLQQVRELHAAGDARAALTAFLETRAADAFRGVLDWLLQTGEFEQALRDFGTFLEIEMPAAFAWQFSAADATRLKQPLLSILGLHSPARARQVHEVLAAWIPQTQKLVLPNAEHAIAMMDPQGIAQALAEFFSRHPVNVKATSSR
jgi:pimeloyl-ACP methyl ester carboxylesterase